MQLSGKAKLTINRKGVIFGIILCKLSLIIINMQIFNWTLTTLIQAFLYNDCSWEFGRQPTLWQSHLADNRLVSLVGAGHINLTIVHLEKDLTVIRACLNYKYFHTMAYNSEVTCPKFAKITIVEENASQSLESHMDDNF
jgi:hypothetical protein